jgi:alpha-aminoadipate/glutamate carrier protein LysW
MSGAERGLRASNGSNEGETTMATCPECGAEIDAGDVEQGEILPCPECGAELEVVSVGPVTLALAPEEGEDWGE